MISKTILLVLVDNRKKTAPLTQEILTDWGCIIKTRLGIHDGVLDNCANSGLIVLELTGESGKQDELRRKLELLEGVTTELVRLSLNS